MKNRLFRNVVLTLLFAAVSSVSVAASKSDLAKEKRWEEQIVDSLLVGEDMHLTSDGTEFLALYAEPDSDEDKGAVILLHGIGVHPAWPDVIDPLRMELPALGWHTLSLQMPVLSNEASDTDYVPVFPEVPGRIQAAVDFLKEKGVTNIVLSGHSLGAAMSSSYLAGTPDPTVKTFVIISGGSGIPEEEKNSSGTLDNMKRITGIDVIDIYGSEDNKDVLKSVPLRVSAMKEAGNDRYQSIRVDGANHFYNGKQAELLEVVSTALDSLSH